MKQCLLVTYYRKYRPQTIEELDNEEIRKRLSNLLSAKSLPHAFLFTGPKGTGKTSAARIIAKSINCERKTKDLGPGTKDKNIEPCNKCSICKAITAGASLDILEIDAASNRGIDEIRDLREKIKLSPSVCKYKVYIIDEVHMLTNEAFNALLKTLEEPPVHAVFILCTTESRKLPETITSRCLRFNFKKATTGELERSINRIINGEKLKIDKEAIKEIAKDSDGSFREAAKILEQLSFEGKKITKESVLEFLGKTKINRADEFLKFLAIRDTKRAILWINSALQNGADLKIITIDLLEILRNFLIKKTAGIESEEIEYGENYDKLNVIEIKELIEIFSQAYFELKSAIIIQLPLELAVVEWIGARQEEQEKQEKKEKSDSVGQPADYVKTKPAIPLSRNPEKREKIIDFNKVISSWPQILEAVKPLNHSVHAVLRSARPLAVEKNLLIIEAFYKFHKEKLEEPRINALLTGVICDKLGCQLGVKCVLGEGKKPVSPISRKPEITEDKNNDLVKAVEEIFK